MLHHIHFLNISWGTHRHVSGMEKRDKLRDIRLIGSYSRSTSILSGKCIYEGCQSLFQCHGVHVRSCLSHLSPTFSYSPKRDKSCTPGKSGSDNMMFFPLYGTVSSG